MQLYCPLSGLNYTASIGFGVHSQVNPALNMSYSQLERLATPFWNQLKTAQGDLSYTPNRYLYLLAWFRQLPTVMIDYPCNPELDYPVLLANCERLLATVKLTKLNRQVSYPAIKVSQDAQLCSQLPHWLDAINTAYAEHQAAKHASGYELMLADLEQVLDSTRNLNEARNAAKSADIVADWAAIAANFPHSVSQLWKDIISASMRQDRAMIISNKVTEADLEELIDHCEGMIPHGSYHAHALMAALRQSKELLQAIKAAAANVTVTKNTTAPEPKRAQYNSLGEYLRARMAWQRNRTTAMVSNTSQTENETETPAQASTASTVSPSIQDLADLLGI